MGLIPTPQTGASRVEQVPECPVACFTEKLLGEQRRKGCGPGKAKSNRMHPSLFAPEQGGAALCCQPLLKPPLGHFLSQNSSLTCWRVGVGDCVCRNSLRERLLHTSPGQNECPSLPTRVKQTQPTVFEERRNAFPQSKPCATHLPAQKPHTGLPLRLSCGPFILDFPGFVQVLTLSSLD